MSMKKGWKRYGIVVFLVLLSMLVPLVFLLGLNAGFQSSYINDEVPPTLNQTDFTRIVSLSKHDDASQQTERNLSRHLDDLNKLGSELSKVSKDEVVTKTSNFSATNVIISQTKPYIVAKDTDFNTGYNFSGTTHGNLDKLLTRHPISGGLSEKPGVSLPESRAEKKSGKLAHRDVQKKVSADSLSDDPDKACEVALGSYCIWRNEHRVEVADATVRLLKNQLFLARGYYPSIIKHRNREKIQQELRKHIQDIEHMLSEATADADLPERAWKKTKIMEGVLAKAKTYPVDCNNVVKKLGQILDLTEDEAHFHRKQSVFLYQLAVQTMPKSLHCLSMRLTVEYFQTYQSNIELPLTKNLEDSSLYHYVIYSTNILAASVVINSTVVHAKEPEKHVFHLITDRQNYVAIKFWFLENTYSNATVHVQSLDDLNLRHYTNSVMGSLSSEEFRVGIESPTKFSNDPSNSTKELKYLSTFNHPHFWLPEIFPSLNKVLFLDDDVVVQRDLTPLWSINLHGKVNGAMEICEVRFHHLRKYLNSSKFFPNGFDGNACAWMSGLNIIDLQQWRTQDLTKVYRRWLKMQNRYNIPWRFGTLPASLITFYNMTHRLEDSWLSVGLGHDFGIDQLGIEKSPVLHYNGNLKPWLEIGINKYKPYWAKYLKQEGQFMLECNVNG